MKTTKLKAFAFLVAMAYGMLLPSTVVAQSDDFFRESDNFGGSRFAVDWVIINNGIGQSEAPLGGGYELLILTVAGVGYAISRRKSCKTHKSYRSGVTFILAFVSLLGMTNCRKIDTISEAKQNGVYITLNVAGEEKVGVNPTGGVTYATVTWEDGDVLYVGNNGAYCGYLIYNGSNFGGTITPTSVDDYLHFYFMGNKGPTSEPTSVNISDQRFKFPVISYGRSTSLYDPETTSYNATLYNKCAIMKFTTTDIDKDITITGMNNIVTVDFSVNGIGKPENPYTYTKTGTGEIRLYAVSNTERWAILLPQDEVTTATAYAKGYSTTSDFAVPEVGINKYYNSGVDVELTVGTPNGAFTINGDGDQVFFSSGNLQAVFAGANSSSCTWRFAPTQYSYIGAATANTAVGSNAVTTAGTVDLFGWVGKASALAAYGINSSTNTNSYGNANDALKVDWAVAANDAMLGGYDDWHTLTKDEWTYLLNTRTNAAQKYGHGSVGGFNGLILLPDVWVLPTGLSFTSGNSAWANSYSSAQWEQMEGNGAVFLPAAGARTGTRVNNSGTTGMYWSSTSSAKNKANAYRIYFMSNNMASSNESSKYQGYSVRLVRVVE